MHTVYKKYITTSAIVWAACFVLFTLGYVLVLGPQQETVKAKKTELAKRDRDFSRAVDADTGVTKERLNKEIAKLRSKADNFMVCTEDASKLVVDIGQIANELKVKDFSSKGSKNEQSPTTLAMCKVLGVDNIHISFKGSFSQFARFVNALERHKPVIFVDKFSIARTDKGAFENDVDMVLAVFVCPQNGSNSNALMAAGP